MQFVEKRPMFYAAQFNGLDFIGKVEHFVDIASYKVTRDGGNRCAQITVGEGLDAASYCLNAYDWLLMDDAGKLSVIADSEMRTRFDAVNS